MRGRPRKAGARRKDGRLAIQPRDYGNIVVQQRRASFEIFQGGKADQQVYDAIGRAWAVGLLDGQNVDAAMLRDKGRQYAELFAAVYAGTAVKTGGMEPRVPGTGEGSMDDPTGRMFARLDELARAAGSKERLAMRKLCVEGSPDENPCWLDRLIMAKIARVRPIEQPMLRDRMIMAQAIVSLVAMVEG